MARAAPTPATPPIADRKAASSRNWTQHLLTPRADSDPQPDLAGPLRDADEHHVGDADRTDEQADAREAHGDAAPMRALRPSNVAMI